MPFTVGQSFKIPPRYVLILAGVLGAIFIHLNLRADTYSHLAISITFIAAAWSTLSDKHGQLKLDSNWVSVAIATILIGLLLLKSAGTPGEKFVGFFPLFSFIALGALASGIRGLKQYRQELIIFFFLGLPRLALALIPNLLAPVTAAFSAYGLWYAGVPVALQNNTIIRLPNGGVEVVPECSGLNLMLYMLGVAVLFLVLFPTSNRQKATLPIAAVSLGFVVNAVRVALLAILSTNADKGAFEYWHSQGGALIFVCIAVLIFGGLCWLLLKPQTGSHKTV